MPGDGGMGVGGGSIQGWRVGNWDPIKGTSPQTPFLEEEVEGLAFTVTLLGTV